MSHWNFRPVQPDEGTPASIDVMHGSLHPRNITPKKNSNATNKMTLGGVTH